MTKSVKPAKRTRLQLTKAILKSYALKSVMRQLKAAASGASDDFILMMIEDKNRTPTEGEKASFLIEYLSIIQSIEKQMRTAQKKVK